MEIKMTTKLKITKMLVMQCKKCKLISIEPDTSGTYSCYYCDIPLTHLGKVVTDIEEVK